MNEFPPYRLDVVNQCLWRARAGAAEERIVPSPKAFAVLRYLVEHPGRLVTHEEFLDAVWPKTHVQPEVLKSHISEIRAVLGDDSKKPIFIETLARRGYRFIAPVGDAPSPVPAHTPLRVPSRLVGRDRTLAELREYFLKMLRGERQFVFVTGEPGIGKTAVVNEFTRWAGGEAPAVRMALGQCVEGYGSKEPYYPMLEAVAGLCRGHAGDAVIQTLAAQAPTWLVQFPALLTRDRVEALQREILGATRERMLREIGDALEAVALRSPVLVVLEDLHWVDYSTVDLISVLARRRSPATLMLIATFRDEDVAVSDHPLLTLKRDLRSRQLCQEVALEPLGETQVAEYLVAETPGSSLPAGLAALVYRHSEGNPLFMAAVLDHLTGRRLLARNDHSWELRVPLSDVDLSVPESLRDLIEAQIERLSIEEQRVLEAASLTPSPSFCVASSAAAADVEPARFEEVCERLSRRTRLLRPAAPDQSPDGTLLSSYEFAHALYREVLYTRIAAGRRAWLHRRAAEWAEVTFSERLNEVAPLAASLAYHFEHGLDWARAVRYLRSAADIAGRRYAPREATVLLQHALELSAKLPDAERAASETELLEQLAATYVVSFDTRAVDAYEALAARAASYGLIDVEVKALIDMVYPLSWIDAQRALQVIDRALRLSAQQSHPLQRARTRASCLVRRIWASGWNPRDAEDCRQAVEEIRHGGDSLMVASHLIEFSFIRWVSSEYRAAQQDVVESLAILVDSRIENPYLSFCHWLSQFTLPWSLLFVGDWGQALRTLTPEIALADKNGERYRAHTLQLYRAWIHLHAMGFPSVLETCGSVLPSFDDPASGPWRRFCLALAGSAEVASGRYEAAAQHVLAARTEMDRRPVIHDWYSRMLLESALTELWLAKRDLAQARQEAECFLELTGATAERTWQALAWEINARVATAARDFQRGENCVAHALSTMEGFEVPLAAWRVHGTAAELYMHTGSVAAAEQHRALSRATILKLANSLSDDQPLRDRFLSAPSVRGIVDPERESRAPSSRRSRPAARGSK